MIYLQKGMFSVFVQTFFTCISFNIHRTPSMQFAVIIILLVLPSSSVYTFCTLLYLSWGCFVTCICTKDCVTFFVQQFVLQSISKHTNVAYIWRDTTSIYIWYISLVYCCIFCTLHPTTHHLFDCCIIIDRYHDKPKHPLISYKMMYVWWQYCI